MGVRSIAFSMSVCLLCISGFLMTSGFSYNGLNRPVVELVGWRHRGDACRLQLHHVQIMKKNRKSQSAAPSTAPRAPPLAACQSTDERTVTYLLAKGSAVRIVFEILFQPAGHGTPCGLGVEHQAFQQLAVTCPWQRSITALLCITSRCTPTGGIDSAKY